MPHTLCFGFVIHGLGMCCVQRQGFLTQQMQTGVERGHGHFVVQIIGRRNHDRIEAGFGNHVPVVAVCRRDTVFVRNLLCASVIASAQRDKVNPII